MHIPVMADATMVLPASAGMIPIIYWRYLKNCCAPRIRGDDPVIPPEL